MSGPHTRKNTGYEITNVSLDLTAHADSQSTSPLFTVFPPEIRAEIFALAVSSFLDTLTKLSLLVTCKRIYTEAKDLVWQRGSGNEEATFWWGFDRRRPPEYGGREGPLDPDSGFDYDLNLWENDTNVEFQDSDSGEEPTWDVVDDGHEELGTDDLGDGYSWDRGSDISAEASYEGPSGGDNSDDDEPDLGVGDTSDESHDVLMDDSHEGLGRDENEDANGDNEGSPLNDDTILQEGPTIYFQGFYNTISTPSADTTDARERYIERFLSRTLADVKRPHPDGPLQSSRQEAFTPSHWSRICRIYIFPQMFAFSSRAFIRTFIQAEGLRPRTVKVTIRYTDWWNWEFNASLDLASIVPEANAYYFPESVDTFIIELESAEHKKNELEEMVKHVLDSKQTWKWKRLDDEYLEFDEDAGVKEWDWMGTTMFDGDKFAHHPQGETMEYIVKVLTFTAKPTQVEWDGTPFDRALAIKGYESSLRTN
ncbi:hypothetical protein BKA70DRAFT_1350005 [Coprinopsis sp. MPI-PUGE-AT-0042]|nr:hypothetical protein BKA70DRAFT_1350005 [Coprinopsis sp. MPI-PUGE-AT-0042]